jgi:hypothetical protein
VTHAHLSADLAVTLDEDRPGMLARALGCVSGAGINIEGYAEISGVVHLLTEDVEGSSRCLREAGFRVVQQQQVVLIPVPDEPGAAARVFQRIADSHVNVRYSYLATGNRLVIASDNPESVIEAASGERGSR